MSPPICSLQWLIRRIAELLLVPARPPLLTKILSECSGVQASGAVSLKPWMGRTHTCGCYVMDGRINVKQRQMMKAHLFTACPLSGNIRHPSSCSIFDSDIAALCRLSPSQRFKTTGKELAGGQKRPKMKCQIQLGRVAKLTRTAQSELAAQRKQKTWMLIYDTKMLLLSRKKNVTRLDVFCVWECHESPWDAWAWTGKMFDTCQKFVIDQSPAIGHQMEMGLIFHWHWECRREGLPVSKTQRDAFWDGLAGKPKEKGHVGT